MQIQIVILSQHSIFAEGIASRLRQVPNGVNVRFVDPQGEEFMGEIKSINPAAVIIDAAAPTNAQCCLLCELLIALPTVTIVRLDAKMKDVQIVRSSQHEVAEVVELFNAIKGS